MSDLCKSPKIYVEIETLLDRPISAETVQKALYNYIYGVPVPGSTDYVVVNEIVEITKVAKGNKDDIYCVQKLLGNKWEERVIHRTAMLVLEKMAESVFGKKHVIIKEDEL